MVLKYAFWGHFRVFLSPPPPIQSPEKKKWDFFLRKKILFSLGTRSDEDPEGGEGAEGAGSGLVEVPATASEAVERVLFQPGGGSPGGHSPD